ncbi:MAG: sugar ABC transporter substrate-binding protein [Chloroflexota bacterium]
MQRFRLIALLTLFVLLMQAIAACGSTAEAPPEEDTSGAEAEQPATEAEPAEEEPDANAEEAAAPAEEPSGEATTLTFWTISLKPTFDDYVNGMIATYEEANPGVTIEWIDIPGDQIEQQLLTAIAGGDVPDVVNLNTDLTLQVSATNPDILVKTSEAVPPEVRSEYFEGLWNSTNYQDATYGIPWYATVRVVVYNQQIFEEAGVEAPPETYDDLVTIAQDVQAAGDKWGYAPNINLVESFLMAGVPLVNEDRTEATFNSPEGIAVAQYYIDLKDQGLIPEDILAKGFQGELQLYKEGSLAMQLAGASLLRQIENDAPEVYANTDVAPHPTREANILPVALMHLVIPSQSESVEQATDFALFVTNAENQLELAKNSVTVPSIIAATEDEFFQQEDTLDAKARKIMAEELAIAQDPFLGLPEWGQLEKALRDEFSAAWAGTKTAEEALNTAAETWNQVLSEQ